MPPRPCTPRPNPVIRAYKILACVHRIVAIRQPADQLPAHIRLCAAVPAAVVCAERVAEGPRRRGQERRGEGARGALREERDARVEAEGEFREGGRGGG